MSFDESGQPILNPDAPLVDPEKAFPSRRRFAAKLAAELRRLPIDQPTITAINGTWGSGKTTVWNLAKTELKAEDFEVLEFNPWRILDEVTLIKTFFEDLGKSLNSLSPSKERQALWKRFSEASSAAVQGVEIASALSAYLTPGGGPAICETIKQVLNGFKAFFTKGHEKAEESEEQDNTLDALRTRISQSLEQMPANKRLLIVIDDLDRLTDDDIYLVIRMVKAVANLPRIHFLLLYDRPQIEAALSNKCANTGSSYLAKIVQLERELPYIPKSDLLSLVEQAVFSAHSPIKIKDAPHFKRLQDLYREAWGQVLKTPRDWNRFANAYVSNWGLAKSENCLELNPVDVVALELLRKAAPKLYAAMPNEEILLLGEDIEAHITSDDTKLKKRFDELLSLAEPGERKVCEYLIRFLFPHAATSRNNQDVILSQARTHLRICHKDLFQTYFQLDPDPEVITEAELESILQVSNMQGPCLRHLQKFNNKKKFINLIDRLLDDPASLKRIGFPGPFIAAIMEAADHGTSVPSPIFGSPIGATLHTSWLADKLIQLLPADDRMHAWQMVVSSTWSRVAVTYWLAEHDPRTPGNKPSECLLTDEEAKSLIDILKEKWPEWLKEPSWFTQVEDKLPGFLWTWLQWGENEHVRILLHHILQSERGVLVILKQLCGSATGIDGTHYFLTKASVENLLPLQDFDRAIQSARPFLEQPENAPYLDAYLHLDQERW